MAGLSRTLQAPCCWLDCFYGSNWHVLGQSDLCALSVLVPSTLGITLSAASAAAINHVAEYRIDALMSRTQHRPLPQGGITRANALMFALAVGLLGMGLLGFFVNLLTAALTFFSLIGYAVIYTMYLKYATPQNIVIGGAAGAAPPVLGWASVTGTVEPDSFALFLIIFLWTPPALLGVAIYRREDYAKAAIPMLPSYSRANLYQKTNFNLHFDTCSHGSYRTPRIWQEYI